MLPLSLEIILVLLAILFYAFFSFAETSVLTVRKSRLREMVEDEESSKKLKRKAKAVLDASGTTPLTAAAFDSSTCVPRIAAAKAHRTRSSIWPADESPDCCMTGLLPLIAECWTKKGSPFAHCIKARFGL